MEEGYDLAVLEAGISMPGEMEKLERIIRPGIGILTNIGAAHQENFSSLTEKLEEKLKLFSHAGRLIFRADAIVDQKPIGRLIQGMDCKPVSWSLKGGAMYNFREEEVAGGHTDISLVGQDGSVISFKIPFSDGASVENAIHVIVFLLETGYSGDFIAEAISQIEPVSMRLEQLKGILGSVLINDSYNADLAGLSSALNLLAQQDPSKPRAVILSDILQTGKDLSQLYAEVAELVRLNGVSLFVGIGPELMAAKNHFPPESLFYPDTGDFIKYFNRTLLKDHAVLIKGSRRFRFEMITEQLQQLVHQTALIIDLNAMVQNLNHYRSLLDPGVRTMVVIKALSYGSGSTEIASLLQFHKVDYLAVAFVDEGIALRESGIYIPIMVLNPDPSSYAAMIDYRLEPEIYNTDGLNSLVKVLDYRGEKNYPVHIKLDTGMHRRGFDSTEYSSLAEAIQSGPLYVKSVFTHLAASDEAMHDAFTREQLRLFEKISSDIISHLGYRPLRHVLNTSGIERFPEAQYDMVRLGIGLHGVYDQQGLVPAASFVTRISQVRKVADGETVGYSRRGKVTGERMIAVIPVGYADGLNRELSNGKGEVWTENGFAPVIGNICMDMTMIDVTGLEVREGDQVEIFGKNQKVSKLAEKLGTIPYEILTGISDRVKKIYLQE